MPHFCNEIAVIFTLIDHTDVRMQYLMARAKTSTVSKVVRIAHVYLIPHFFSWHAAKTIQYV